MYNANRFVITKYFAAGVICRMVNAEVDYSLLDQRKYIHAKINPNPIANNKPYPINLKLLNEMAAITEKLAIYVFLLT